ncbi:HhH-GPD-type base excision DNA repair protein [Cryobacterium sp. PAMC25264]|uniref:HhH-GPD-type base excision DNA repair protein n=1 Tax=Cryobacterium sp. PAMC25264 TaxID=2861288 RepID=UPI001C62B991|nr:HhH-GPD-type base excision DNA repair protein [Cryobacterium sp. PAMC25264]QYF74174.1 Fe-S cluster assembly protein HesB [Cryobacterium sp. PAMC25264]
MTLHLTGDTAADSLLSDDPFALLVGMLLDQQIPMETAFAGPAKIRDRLGTLDPAVIARYDPTEFVEVFRQTPAVHRFPGSMAGRVQNLAAVVAEDWHGDAAAIWSAPNDAGTAPDGAEVLRRLKALPGFGEQKAKIFLALLGKRLGAEAAGWREASAPYGEEGSLRSVADIVDQESLAKVRESKRAAKAAAKESAAT